MAKLSVMDTQLPALKSSWAVRITWLMLAAYVIYVFSLFDVTSERLVEGLHQGGNFIGRMIPPDFSRWTLLQEGLIESLKMAVIATVLGFLISVPIGLFAATNLMPSWISWPTRGLIALCRSFHPVIIAIVFVKAVGFGALAGVLTLTVFSVGFIAKVFAEAIEEISMKPIEAIRATGAPFLHVVIFAVMPQVITRLIGFSTYQLDSNLRNSTMVGIVGAGGVGGTLLAAFQRFDFDFVAAILIAIIALVMLGEYLATHIRSLYE